MKADIISSPSQTVNGVAGSRNSISDGSMPGDFMMALMAALIQQGTGFESGTGSSGDYLLQQGQPTPGELPVEVAGTVMSGILNKGIPEVIPAQGKDSNILYPEDSLLFEAGNMLQNAVITEDISGITVDEPAGNKATTEMFYPNNLTGLTIAGSVPAKQENINLSITSKDPPVTGNSNLPAETVQKAVPVFVEVIETLGTNPLDAVEGKNPVIRGDGTTVLNHANNNIHVTQQDIHQIQPLIPDKVLKDVSVTYPELEQDRLTAVTESQAGSQKDIILPESNKKAEIDKSSFLKGETVEALKSAENGENESPDAGFTGKDGNQGEEVAAIKPGKYVQGEAQINNGTIHFTSITAKKFPAEIVPYVLNAVRNSAGDNNRVTVIKLKLEPENLGEIKIRLSYSKGELTAHFFTTSSMVKEAVEFSLPQLRETLSQYNIDLGDAGAFVGQEQQNNSGSKYSGYRYSGTGGDLSGNLS